MDHDFLLDEALYGNRKSVKARAGLGRVYGRMFLSVLILVLALVSVSVFAQVPKAALSVTTVRVERLVWPVVVAANGPIAAQEEQIVSALVPGLRIAEVNKSVGDRVKRGQVLVRFDSESLRIDARELSAAVAQYEASDVQAQDGRMRALAIRESGAISAQDIVQLETQARIVREQLMAARARLDAKRWQIRNAVIKAPDDGVISARSATTGTVSTLGQELFRIIRRGRLEWRGELTSSQLSGVVAGQAVHIVLPDGSEVLAWVREIGPSLSGPNRLATVYAELPGSSTARAAMYASGRIEIGTRAANTVPAGAVILRDGRSLVARVSEKGGAATVKMVPVVTGRYVADQVEIVQGVDQHELIVDRGAGFLGDGDIVKIVNKAKSSVPSESRNDGGRK